MKGRLDVHFQGDDTLYVILSHKLNMPHMKLSTFSLLILFFPSICFGQTAKDCKNLKRELLKIERAGQKETLPDKRIKSDKIWLTKYEELEKCTDWILDIDLADKANHKRKVLETIEIKGMCIYCEEYLSKDIGQYSSAQIVESLQNCGCDGNTPLLVEAKSEIAINGTIEDCDNFLVEYPNHELSSKVKENRNKKIEYQDYLAAFTGTVQQCNKYLSKYPQGTYASEVQAKRDRLTTTVRNSNPALWSQGDRICTSDNPSGQIQAVIEQWNDNKTKLKVKIIAGYEGMYKGEDVYKGNMIWIAPDGWYKCIGDENLNYNIPSAGIGGVTDRTKYKYSVGDLLKCRMWANGDAGYNASVLDKKDGKYLVKVTKIITAGFFSTNLTPSKCSGHLRLVDYKERLDDEGVGSVFWVDKSCVE